MVGLDVTDIDSIKAAVAHAETEMGSIDILVNNSGVSTTQRIQDVTEEDFDYVFDTNVKGSFFVAQEVGKRMLARSAAPRPAASPAATSSTSPRPPACACCRRSACMR